jgi:hypothetical protein
LLVDSVLGFPLDVATSQLRTLLKAH